LLSPHLYVSIIICLHLSLGPHPRPCTLTSGRLGAEPCLLHAHDIGQRFCSAHDTDQFLRHSLDTDQPLRRARPAHRACECALRSVPDFQLKVLTDALERAKANAEDRV